MRWYIFFIVSNGGHAASRPPCRSNASSLSRDTSPDTNKTKHGTQATTKGTHQQVEESVEAPS